MWNAMLLSKHDAFKLFAADLPQTPGADIVFEIRTDAAGGIVNFPISQIDPTAWHDLVARYDGTTLTLLCDGKKMASKPCSGRLERNNDALLIGAGKISGKVAQHFRGELEEAAVWSRALSDREVAALLHP
jgi:hypothetical protein